MAIPAKFMMTCTRCISGPITWCPLGLDGVTGCQVVGSVSGGGYKNYPQDLVVDLVIGKNANVKKELQWIKKQGIEGEDMEL